jgi:hypothetical protein
MHRLSELEALARFVNLALGSQRSHVSSIRDCLLVSPLQILHVMSNTSSTVCLIVGLILSVFLLASNVVGPGPVSWCHVAKRRCIPDVRRGKHNMSLADPLLFGLFRAISFIVLRHFEEIMSSTNRQPGPTADSADEPGRPDGPVHGFTGSITTLVVGT